MLGGAGQVPPEALVRARDRLALELGEAAAHHTRHFDPHRVDVGPDTAAIAQRLDDVVAADLVCDRPDRRRLHDGSELAHVAGPIVLEQRRDRAVPQLERPRRIAGGELLEEVARETTRKAKELALVSGLSEEGVTPILYGLARMGYLAEDDGGYRVGNWFFERWLRRATAVKADEARPV